MTLREQLNMQVVKSKLNQMSGPDKRSFFQEWKKWGEASECEWLKASTAVMGSSGSSFTH
jgi:hypothetical protein